MRGYVGVHLNVFFHGRTMVWPKNGSFIACCSPTMRTGTMYWHVVCLLMFICCLGVDNKKLVQESFVIRDETWGLIENLSQGTHVFSPDAHKFVQFPAANIKNDAGCQNVTSRSSHEQSLRTPHVAKKTPSKKPLCRVGYEAAAVWLQLMPGYIHYDVEPKSKIRFAIAACDQPGRSLETWTIFSQNRTAIFGSYRMVSD